MAAGRGIVNLEYWTGDDVEQFDGYEQALVEAPLPVRVQDPGGVQQTSESFFLQWNHRGPRQRLPFLPLPHTGRFATNNESPGLAWYGLWAFERDLQNARLKCPMRS